MKKFSFLVFAFSMLLCSTSFASPYFLINLNLSPSTTLSSDNTTVKNAYGGSSVGFEGIFGYQIEHIAFESSLAYMLYPEYRDYSATMWFNIEPTTFDAKIALLLSPNVNLGNKIINPFYIGPEVGVSLYRFSATPYKWNEYGILYGVKTGARIPIDNFFINVGLSYLKRSGMILPLTNTNISSSNINFNLGLGYYF